MVAADSQLCIRSLNIQLALLGMIRTFGIPRFPSWTDTLPQASARHMLVANGTIEQGCDVAIIPCENFLDCAGRGACKRQIFNGSLSNGGESSLRKSTIVDRQVIVPKRCLVISETDHSVKI